MIEPHLDQLKGTRYIQRHQNDLPRILSSDFPRQKYRRRKGEYKSTLHWGQRKLLMSEIEFLTKYTTFEQNITCVYAGAAPGTHISFLSELFPNVSFVLIDPSDFSINETKNIKIRQEFMTELIAHEYSNLNILFISDVRSIDHRLANSLNDLEKGVNQDMTNQMTWHLIINPIAGMYKFRLPWNDNISEYLKGDICFPVWGPQNTTECRLIVNSNEKIMYDHKLIEEQLCYFNNITRLCYYTHNNECTNNESHSNSNECKIYDHCYDCTSEIIIITNYLLRLNQSSNTAITQNKINDYINLISFACSTGSKIRTLFEKPIEKHNNYKLKIFDSINNQIIYPNNSLNNNNNCNNNKRKRNNNKTFELLENLFQNQLNNENKVFEWTEVSIDEISLDDIDDYNNQIGIICGSFIQSNSLFDYYLWNCLNELLFIKSNETNNNCQNNRMTKDNIYSFDLLQLKYHLINQLTVNNTSNSIASYLLLYNNNCGYIFTDNLSNKSPNLEPTITKIYFPTNFNTNNFILFEINIILLQENYLFGYKNLEIINIISLNNINLIKTIKLNNKNERIKICKEFIKNELNFTNNEYRQNILQLSGFDNIYMKE